MLPSRRLRGQLQFASDYLHDLRVGLIGAPARVHHGDTPQFPGSNRQICVSHTTEEGTTLLLETTFIFSATSRVAPSIPTTGAFNASGNVGIHEDRELGFQIATQNMM